ncbi:MAG TPA: hypothetical protein VFH78_03085 [Candidatus Thermoplasmatota archaeon]|nr:hypothetical protein [Candidatus Thermoplasmatota archaeon]
MVSKLTLLGSALLAWGGIAALSGLVIDGTRFEIALVITALLTATGGLVVSIIGAARYEPY